MPARKTDTAKLLDSADDARRVEFAAFVELHAPDVECLQPYADRLAECESLPESRRPHLANVLKNIAAEAFDPGVYETAFDVLTVDDFDRALASPEDRDHEAAAKAEREATSRAAASGSASHMRRERLLVPLRFQLARAIGRRDKVSAERHQAKIAEIEAMTDAGLRSSTAPRHRESTPSPIPPEAWPIVTPGRPYAAGPGTAATAGYV